VSAVVQSPHFVSDSNRLGDPPDVVGRDSRSLGFSDLTNQIQKLRRKRRIVSRPPLLRLPRIVGDSLRLRQSEPDFIPTVRLPPRHGIAPFGSLPSHAYQSMLVITAYATSPLPTVAPTKKPRARARGEIRIDRTAEATRSGT